MLQNNNNSQIHIFNLTTDAFYTSAEKELHDERMETINKISDMQKNNEPQSKIKELSDYEKNLKSQIKSLAKENQEVRTLNDQYMTDNAVISLFDSVLTRTIGIKENELSKDLMVVEAYFVEVLEDLINDGFYYNNEKYIFFSSSAGQTRNKKSEFIKESVYENIKGSLMCGLSKEEINRKGGVNLNKYLAYVALTASSTTEWQGFDINRTIVVPDLETNVTETVDHIDPSDYSIERKDMVNSMEQTDGCGMVMPHISDKAFMTRLPFVKGLLTPFNFQQFAEEKANTYIITDIYGKEYDVRDIDVIFTASQFKMKDYYDDWEDYKSRFIENKCQAGIMNVEDTSRTAKFNYQMMQTLTDITDEELQEIAQDTIDDINSVGQKDTMLKILGANKADTPYRKSLSMLPELLKDEYSKQIIKDSKKSMVKDAKAGKVDVNGKFTFCHPDLYAFCQSLFGLEVTGLLDSNEVFCDLYNESKVDVLRSPHLYREHAVRDNVVNDDEKSKWFITNGIYISIHDDIENYLASDYDGDQLLVIQDETIINAAQRNMKDIVPLDYEMAKGSPQQVTSKNIYNNLIEAYKVNIGRISNDISKIWNSDNIDIEAIKYLSMENNFIIDYAKTGYSPKRPQWIDERIKQYTNKKLPHFFKFAKDKGDDEVEEINNSPVNRLGKLIPKTKISWKLEVGNLDYTLMMNKSKVKQDDALIAKYKELNNKKGLMIQDHSDNDDEKNNAPYIYSKIKNELLEYGSESYVTDQLVNHLYSKNNSKKSTLWYCFGEQILHNLEYNMENKAAKCEDCGSKIRQNTKMQVKCSSCQSKKRSKKRGKKTKK